MIEREIKQNLLQVCKVKGWDSDFNVLAFYVLCDKLKELGAKEERERFYGQDKPAECSEGCPPNQICDYCQVVAPVKALILAEREACAEVCKKHADFYAGLEPSPIAQSAWAACIDNRDTILARGQA
jgi:hypothetical protein